jgi:hypothetical protein
LDSSENPSREVGVKRSSFAALAVLVLAGCETAPAPTAAVAAPAAKPAVSKTPANANGPTEIAVETDVGPLLNLNLDADDPSQVIPAKTFPTADIPGFRIALIQDMSMPVVSTAPVKGVDGLVQITARVCNRSTSARTVDLLCQVGSGSYYYVLPRITFPPHYARDLRLRINTPDAGATVWLSVRNARASDVPVTTGPVDRTAASPTIPVPGKD